MKILILILRWTFGLGFVAVGVMNLPLQIAPGAACLVIAAILLPPVNAILISRWDVRLSPGSKVGLVFLACLLIGVTVREMEIRTQIDIDAQPERVWAVLTDFPSHADWNPFLTIEGQSEEGAVLTIVVQSPNGESMSFRPTLLVVRPAEKLEWLGRLLIPRVFDGRHIYELEPLDDGTRTRFHHYEKFRGLLVPLLWESLNTDTRQGFESMNKALKAESER